MGKKLPHSGSPTPQPSGAEITRSLRAIALIGQRLHRAKSQHFGAGLFGDPAWEIVQLLLAENHAALPLSFANMLTALEISSNVLRRYLQLLASRGIIVECWPETDTYVLSSSAREKLLLAFREVKLIPE
jgi:hypothetical protein